MGAFSVLGEKFQRASCDFSYENGNFYVTDLDIRHPGGSFSGKVMGVDGEIKVDVHSTLPMKAMLGMARSIAPEDAKLPPALEIRGDPELKVYGSVDMGKGWKGPFQVDRLQIEASVADVFYQGVEFVSAAARAELIGRSINVTQLELVRDDGRVKLEGSYLGTDLVFTLESNLKPELLETLAGNWFSVPENLQLPEKRFYGCTAGWIFRRASLWSRLWSEHASMRRILPGTRFLSKRRMWKRNTVPTSFLCKIAGWKWKRASLNCSPTVFWTVRCL